jgi:molybdenum cofactor cytidylyltransferase
MSSKAQTAGIILAAGSSVRFGHPKQLIKLRGKYLVEWVADAALNSRLQTVVLVLGHAHQEIINALGTKGQHPKLEVVVNHRYHVGQSTSLRIGLSRVRQDFAAVMYLLADQPMITSDTIDYLLDQFNGSDKDICVPVFEGQRGNPAIFRRSVYDEIMMIEGDIGAREIINKNAERVLYAKIKDPLCFFDIDTPEDLENLKARIDSSGSGTF